MFSIMLVGCSFSFVNSYQLKDKFKYMSLSSFDNYAPIFIKLKHELKLHNVILVDNYSENIPSLELKSVEDDAKTVSVFKQGREAEKIIDMRLVANLKIDGKNHELTVEETQSFFDNSRLALAKTTEKEMLLNDMQQSIVVKLIDKINQY